MPKIKDPNTTRILTEYAQVVSRLFQGNFDPKNIQELQMSIAQKLIEVSKALEKLNKKEQEKVTEWLKKLPETISKENPNQL
jgi:hypothetical protein